MKISHTLLVGGCLVCVIAQMLFSQGADIPCALAVASDGYSYVTGTSMSAAGKMDIITIAYDPNGRQQGWQRYETKSAGASIPTGILVNGDNIIVTATSPADTSGYDILTLSYSRSSLVSVEEQPTHADEMSLEQSYPNPVSSSGQGATITFSLPDRAHVKLTVTDNTGREIAVLVQEEKNAGKHEAQFNPSTLPSGTYYYVLQSSTSARVKKLLVIR